MQFKENSINIDVGCGDGWISKKISHLLPSNSTLYSVDWNKPRYMHNQKSSFIRSDILNLPFKDSSIDSILLSSILQVVHDDNMLLKEMNRVIKKEGNMVVTVPTGYPLIEKFMRNKLFYKIIKLIKQKDTSYHLFKDETNKMYNIVGKGFYDIDQVKKILQMNGFKVIGSQKSPGAIGSFIFQFLIFSRYIMGSKKLTSKIDILFLPFLQLDKILRISKFYGIELILKVEKISNLSETQKES